MPAKAKQNGQSAKVRSAPPTKRALDIPAFGYEEALRVGDQHWTIRLTDGGTLSVRCEQVEVDQTGNLLVYATVKDEDGVKLEPLLGLARGEWRAFYATEALLDTSAVCVADYVRPC